MQILSWLAVLVLGSSAVITTTSTTVRAAEGGMTVQASGSVERAPAPPPAPEHEPLTVAAGGSVSRPGSVPAAPAPEPVPPETESPTTSAPTGEPTLDPTTQLPSSPPSGAPTTSAPTETEATQAPTSPPVEPTEAPSVAAVEDAADEPLVEAPVENIELYIDEEYRNETVAFEDFEQGNDFSWTNQRVTETDYFSSFLGRFGQNEDGTNAFTNASKTYHVPRRADRITVEFDFFELDLWCDCDHFKVMICGQTVNMGEFSQHGSSEQSGTKGGGIEWFRHAQGRNTDLGFSQFRDGVHKMGVSVPRRCFRDGLLEVEFNVTIDGGYELASAGIDNINITAYDVPQGETEAPSMSPTDLASSAPTVPLNLDVCVTDVMYDFKANATVHRKCFDLFAIIEMVDDTKVIGQACVEAKDNDNFQVTVRHTGPWDLRKASAWTGASLNDAPRLPNSHRLEFKKFQASRTWSEGEEDEWVTTLPLMNAVQECGSGLNEFSELIIVHALGSGPGEKNGTVYYQAYAQEHFDDPGQFYWGQLVFSCSCDRSIQLDPPPTGAPSTAPSVAPAGLPSTMPTHAPTVHPSTVAPTGDELEFGIGQCVASVDGSGRECHPLIGENNKTAFGQVCVELVPKDDEDDPNFTLNVTYVTDGQYRLTRNFLWVGHNEDSQVPIMRRALDVPRPDLEAFPHFSCNWLGTKTWTKLIPLGPRCENTPDGTVLRMSLVAHSEVATATSDGTVALGTIGTRAFGAEHTQGTVGDPSWYEVINFKIMCQCSYVRGKYSDSTMYDPYLGVPTAAPSKNPTGIPTSPPSEVPTIAPSLLPSLFPTAAPSQLPSLFPSSHAPSPAPTYECRPAWAVKEGKAHCFKTLDNKQTEYENAPYGWYNGIFHLENKVTMNLYAEDDSVGDDCKHGEKVGTVHFSYVSKIVTVSVETIGDFFITESQAHVGADMLPTDEQTGSYITDPSSFELHKDKLSTTKVDHFLRGCQEDNWVVARAVVCGSFTS